MDELKTRECIGCGYCCRKTPCWLGVDIPCRYLFWNGKKWRCKLIQENESVHAQLAADEGCCSGLNTYQRYKRVPTPEELKDEKALLKQIEKEWD